LQLEERAAMKTGPFHLGLVLGLMVLGGCAGSAGKTVARQAQQGAEFRPKRVYAVEMKQAWDLTLKALKREGIPLEMVNKEIGVIRTEYQNLSLWERSKCDIRFSQEPQRRTHIYVLCRYEGRKDANESFRDFTYSSPRMAMKAEEEIYRKLEPYILSSERISPPKEEGSVKAVIPSVPAPFSEKPGPKAEASMPSTPPAMVPFPAATQARAGTVTSTTSPVAEAEKLQPAARTAQPPRSKEEAAVLTAAVLPKKAEIKKKTLSTPLMTVAPTNVRVDPSTQSKIAAVLNKGERVEKTGESGSWTRIKLSSGQDAWVFTDFLQPATSELSPTSPAPEVQPSPQTKPEQAREILLAKAGEPDNKGIEEGAKIILMTREIAKMWAEPNPKSEVVLVLKKGRKVERLTESGEFTKVRLSWGSSGWVLTRSLQTVP
jgi:SH3-like domain-containing protein